MVINDLGARSLLFALLFQSDRAERMLLGKEVGSIGLYGRGVKHLRACAVLRVIYGLVYSVMSLDEFFNGGL